MRLGGSEQKNIYTEIGVAIDSINMKAGTYCWLLIRKTAGKI